MSESTSSSKKIKKSLNEYLSKAKARKDFGESTKTPTYVPPADVTAEVEPLDMSEIEEERKEDPIMQFYEKLVNVQKDIANQTNKQKNKDRGQKPPTFDGNKPDIEEWLFKMNNYFKAEEITSHTRKILLIVGFLQGEALDWHRAVTVGTAGLNW